MPRSAIMEASVQEGNITAEEAVDVEKLRQSFPSETTDSAGMVLDDACLVRYLRARNGNVAKAASMLSATLEWRREFDVHKLLKEELDVVARENSTGKVYMSGFDREGRPVMVMRPRCENTNDHDGNIKHLVYQMERARAILQKRTAGFSKICLIIDYTGFSLRNASPMRTSMAVVKILQNHYPESLGVAYFMAPPLIFMASWKVLLPFIDVTTRRKFVFVSGDLHKPTTQDILSKNFVIEELEQPLGGKYSTKFDSATYLAAPMDQDFRSALAAASGDLVSVATR